MRNPRVTILGVVALAGALFGQLAGVAQAVDGVVLIDQTDPAFAGFPVVINQPGSYRLASNLIVPDANTTAIQIVVDNVTLDLNGFSILGPVTCSGEPPVCSSQGSGTGVDGFGRGTTITNGTIRGMGNVAIDVGNNATVRQIRALGNAGTGIAIGENSTVSDNTVSDHPGTGIFGRQGNLITRNVVTNSGFGGINTTGTNGVGSTISANTSRGNRFGISAAGSSLVLGNTVVNNRLGGLDLQPTTGYANNVLDNPGAPFGNVHDGVNLGHNLCGNALCP